MRRADSRSINSRNSSRTAGSSFAPVCSISTAVTIACQRRAELVGRVRRELALRPLVPLSLRLIRDHQDGRIRVDRRRDAGNGEHPSVTQRRLQLNRDPRSEQVGDDAREHRLLSGLDRRIEVRPSHHPLQASFIRELDPQIATDEDDSVRQPAEQPLEPVRARRRPRSNRLGQLAPHSVDRPRQAPDLIGKPIDTLLGESRPPRSHERPTRSAPAAD